MVDDDIAQDGVIYSAMSQHPAIGEDPFETVDVDYTGLIDGTSASSISPNFDENGYMVGSFKPTSGVGFPAGWSGGLFADASKLGYADSSGVFQTYMDNTGNFYLNGDGDNRLSWNGSTLYVRGNIKATSVVASVSLSSPTITSGTIVSSTLRFGKESYFDTTAGYYIGGTQMNIGTSTNYMKFNGSSLTISGNITGSSGTFGGLTLSSSGLSSSQFSIDSSGNASFSGTLSSPDIVGGTISSMDSVNFGNNVTIGGNIYMSVGDGLAQRDLVFSSSSSAAGMIDFSSSGVLSLFAHNSASSCVHLQAGWNTPRGEADVWYNRLFFRVYDSGASILSGFDCNGSTHTLYGDVYINNSKLYIGSGYLWAFGDTLYWHNSGGDHTISMS
jgi:hypothetical protein